jgi:hypothetical protein
MASGFPLFSVSRVAGVEAYCFPGVSEARSGKWLKQSGFLSGSQEGAFSKVSDEL